MGASEIKVKISAVTNGFDEAISKVETSLAKLKKTGQSVGNSATKWGNRFSAAGKALLPASLAAGALTGATVKLGAEYQAQMGKVQAISGATSTEMARLKKVGMDATAGTKFSAIEAGQAYEYMGMAGWKTGQMVDGLKPILDLATASGADLGTTSDIVTDSLTAFGLKAKDTAMFTDVLAAASTNSNTNVQMMGETFKYAAPIAGTLGYSVKDTALAIGLMANAGIKGSQAGTTLRSSLTNLASPSKAASDTMQKLGIHTTDTQGKMLPLKQVLDQLRTSFRTLSKEEQAQNAELLFGKEAMSGMLAIINASDDDYNKLAGAINNSTGAAEKMAKTMANSEPIQAAMAQIKNAMISTGEVVMPVVAKIAKGVEKMAKAFQKLPAPIKGVIVGFLGIVTVAAPILIFVGKILTGFGALQTIAAGLGISILGLAGQFLIVIAVIAGVIAAGVAIYKNWDSIKAKAKEVADGIKQAWAGVKDFFSTLWEGIKEVMTSVWNSIKETAISIWTGISESIMTLISPLLPFFTDIWNAIKEVVSTIWNAIVEVATTIFSALGEFFTTIWDGITEVWTTVWSAISSVVGSIWNGMVSLATAIWTTVSDFLSPIWDSVSNLWKSIWEGISSFLSNIWTSISMTAKTIFKIIGTVISTVWNSIKVVTTSLWNGIKGILKAIWEGLKTTVKGVWDGIKIIISTTWNIIKSITTSVWNGIKAVLTGNFGAIKSIVISTWANIKATINNAWNSIKSVTTSVWNGIKSTISGILNAIKSTFSTIFNGIKNVVKQGMDAVRSTMTNGMNNAKNAISNMVGAFVSVGRNLVAGIARGIVSGIGGVINAAVSAVKRAVSAAKAAAGIHSPSKVMAREVGRWIPAGMAVGIEANTDSVTNQIKELHNATLDSALPITGVGFNMPDYSVDDLQNTTSDRSLEVNKSYSFVFKLGNRAFKAFAKDIEYMNDRELELVEYSPV